MAGTDGQVILGLYNEDNIQDRLRKYAQDKDYFRFWAFRQRNVLSILKVISEKFGSVPGEVVSDWKIRYPEFDEIGYQFYIHEDSATTDSTNTKFKIANSEAAVLNKNTRLIVDGIYTKKTVTTSSDFATTRDVSAGIVLPEEMRVVSVGAEDSGGSGYRLVTVKRGYPADSYTGTAPQITTSMQLTVSNLVSRANDFPSPPISKNSTYLENVVQISRHSYGLGEHMVSGGGIDSFLANGTNEYLGIQYNLAEMYVMKAMERAIITGRKSEKTIDGNGEFEAGGILEFVPVDTDHYINFGGKVPSVSRINTMIRRIADVAGVQELWWFTGSKLSQQIANAYEDKTAYMTNAKLSVEYQMVVRSIEGTGKSVVIHHVDAPILNEIGMANEGLVLNLTEYNWNEKQKFGCFQIAHKVPFTDKPDDAESYKSNEGFQGKWRELYGAWTLIRRLADTQFITHNFASANNL